MANTVPATERPRNLPPANQPGHHPEKEQDRPQRTATFRFSFQPLFEQVGKLVGVRPDSAEVEVRAHEVIVRFGPWGMRFDRALVTGAEVTGPFHPLKVIGPPHLSLADRGITFATNARRGVCIQLAKPQKGIEPLGVLKHPGLTVTVADPDGLVQHLLA